MKSRAQFTVILGFLIALPAGAIPHLGEGRPGCFRAIVERPMTDESARKLTPDCRDFRAAYIGGLKAYAADPSQFEREIARSIESHRGADPAYRAIVLAAAFGTPGVIPALEVRAKVEESRKLKFAYATAALERVRTGSCSPRFEAPGFEEVCRVSAPVARRLVELARAGGRK